MRREWVQPIKSLCRLLITSERSIELLRDIDAGMRAYLDGDTELDSLLADVFVRLRQISGAAATHFYLLYRAYDKVPLLVYSSNGTVSTFPKLNERILALSSWNRTEVFPILEKPDVDDLKTLTTTEAACFSVLPHPGRGIVGVILLEFPETTPELTDATLNFVAAISEQLANLFRLREEWRRRATDAKLLSTFLNRKLKPSECLHALAHDIVNQLPDFGPLRIAPAPQLQILFYRNGDEHLTIQASTSNDTPLTRIQVADSVCGYLVENNHLEFYLCDNGDARYKWYLGRRSQTEMRSELAVPIREDGVLIAVLNFESTEASAFRPQHVDAARAVAQYVATWVSAIRDRIDVSVAKERAITSVMEDYIAAYGREIRHNARGKVMVPAVSLDRLQREIAKTQPEISERVSKILTSVRQFHALLEDFISDAGNAAIAKNYSIKKLVQESVDQFTAFQEEHSLDGIRITISEGPDYEVYCSKLLRQHLYNVLDNSLFWLHKRRAVDPDHEGRIEISVSRVAQDLDEPNPKLNERCVVKVWDNGLGVLQESLSTMKSFPLNYTSRKLEGGTGYGLWSLQQYIQSIGGWVELASTYREYFEVSLRLDVYNKSVHSGPTTKHGFFS